MSSSESYHPKSPMRATLLDAVVAQDNGEWISVEGMKYKSVEIIITGTATAQIFISNAPTQPLDSEDHVQFGANVTANGVTAVTTIAAWLKVKVSAYTGGTVSAYLQGIP